MATPQTVKSKIQNLINASNNVTGKTDTTLTDSFNSLISLGGGTKLNIHYGDEAPEDTSMLWCKCEEPEKILINSNVFLEEGINTNIAGLTFTGSCDAAIFGSKVYVFGIDYVNVWSPGNEIAESLTITGDYNISNAGFGAVGNKAYFFGGRSSKFLDTIRVFDTSTNSITTLETKLPAACSDMGVGVVGTKIYLFGGQTDTYGNALETVNVFDTKTETITTVSTNNYHSGRYKMGVGVVGTDIYLFGGDDKNLVASSLVRLFNTKTNSFESISSSLPYSVYNMGVGVVGTKIYLFGGYSDVAIDTISVFDTKNFTSSTLSLRQFIESGGIVVFNDKIYLFGGYNASKSSDEIHEFLPKLPVEQNKLLIHSSAEENVFNILNGNAILKTGVKAVYLGNESTYEPVESLLYKNLSWTEI